MSTSKQLRSKAWASLKGKYWNVFLGSFVASFLLAVSSTAGNMASGLSDIIGIATEGGAEMTTEMALGAMVILSMALIFLLIEIVAYALINGPMNVGLRKAFLVNAEEKAPVGTIFYGFQNGYGSNVKVMLLASIKVFLWSLLLVIPGIIKSYEYFALPYILAENPGVSSKDAFARSKQLMTGNKFRLFKLQLSFIGWFLLCIVTFGIGSLFLPPYLYAAETEFYREISAEKA